MRSMNAQKSILLACAKKLTLVLLLFGLAGCSTLNKKDMEEGYREGVQENIRSFAQNFYANDFPYFNWVSPLVQNVEIPAHIENGLFIPDHSEPVLIEPGAWRNKFSYPISSAKNTQQVKEEGSYAVKYVDFNPYDITVLPASYPGNN